MAQINLLKQSAPQGRLSGSVYKSLIWVIVVGFILIICYYAFLFWQTSDISSQMEKAQSQMAAAGQQAMTDPKRGELLTRQLQIKDLTGLIAGHLYWSQIFPELAR